MPEKDSKKIEISYVPTENKQDKKKQSQPKEDANKKALRKLKEAAEKQKARINELEAEKLDFKDKYLRSLAEMDNFRKRVKKEKEEFQKYVLGDFLLNLLEVYDNFERAMNTRTGEDNRQTILSGVQMIFKQLQELLKKYQVKEQNPLNQTFDPNFHQALSKEEKPGINEPTVVEVYQKGFLYNGKLLRPALVKVAIPVEEQAAESEEENG